MGRDCRVEPSDSQAELITNRHLVGTFDGLARRPFPSALLLAGFFVASLCVAAQYHDLKAQPVSLDGYHTQLREVRKALREDFGPDPEATLHEVVVIWGTGGGASASGECERAAEQVRAELRRLRDERSGCRSLRWGALRVTAAGDAAALPVRIEIQDGSERVRAQECVGAVRQVAAAQSDTSLRVAAASARAVMEASSEECDAQTRFHLVLSAPLLAFMLLLGVETVPRLLSPFLCLFGSVTAERALIVLVKWCWDDLNLSGPDTQIVFIQLALCFDYALFYWVRYAEERRGPKGDSIEGAVVATLQSSGFVILLSTAVLVVAFVGASCYPYLNQLGYLDDTLQLTFGVLFVGLYSLLVPSLLAASLPAIFDNGDQDSAVAALGRIGSVAQDSLVKPTGKLVTSAPFVYLLPAVVLICICPLIREFGSLVPNFDVTSTDFSRSVPESEAYEILAGRFQQFVPQPPPVVLLDIARADSVSGRKSVVESALLSLPHSERALRKYRQEAMHLAPGLPVAAHERVGKFRELACELSRVVVQETRGQSFEITAEEISSVWWDPSMRACSSVPLNGKLQGRVLSTSDGDKQLIILHTNFSGVGAAAQALIRKFWSDIEPKVERSVGGTEGTAHGLEVHLYTPLAEEMLLEAENRRAGLWIFLITVLVISSLVGLVFSSCFVGLKMVITVVLPIIAEYGLANGVFQHGWLEDVGIAGTGGLKWVILYTTSGFLFALAMDYDLLLFSRVYERRLQGYDNRAAVRLAFEETTPVITLAGTIMVVSFVFISASTVPVIAQIGFLYSAGVAFDVYVVRVWLAPPALCVYAPINYWPGRLPPVTKAYCDASEK